MQILYEKVTHYIGIIIAELRLVLPKDETTRGWVGVKVDDDDDDDDDDNDFGVGAAHLPKLVVLPLNALMLKDNLASGATVAEDAETGFKGIL